jgi:hypothetical protein
MQYRRPVACSVVVPVPHRQGRSLRRERYRGLLRRRLPVARQQLSLFLAESLIDNASSLQRLSSTVEDEKALSKAPNSSPSDSAAPNTGSSLLSSGTSSTHRVAVIPAPSASPTALQIPCRVSHRSQLFAGSGAKSGFVVISQSLVRLLSPSSLSNLSPTVGRRSSLGVVPSPDLSSSPSRSSGCFLRSPWRASRQPWRVRKRRVAHSACHRERVLRRALLPVQVRSVFERSSSANRSLSS